MTTEITTQSKVPAFVEEKLKTLEGALVYATTLCKSKVLPAHFYEKGGDGKPDFNKPKPEAVVVVLQYGQEIGMTHMQALQQLVPVNNLVGIKGDGAKALVLGSGKATNWKEEEVGEAGKDTWGFKITATRKDTGETSSAVFTVFDAKRASLWIDEAAIQRNQGLRHSPWYRFPRRMLRYRALGFICRDMFSDVLQGVHIEEEIDNTINVDAKIINTDDGQKIDLSKQEQTEKRTDEVLGKVVKETPLQPAPTRKPSAKKVEIEEAQVIEPEPQQQGPKPISAMTPPEMAEELKAGIPYLDELFKRGMPKSVQLGKVLLQGLRDGKLEEVLTQAGVEFKDLMYPAEQEEKQPQEKGDDEPGAITSVFEYGDAPRNMVKCAEIADYFEAAGMDVTVMAEAKNMDVMQWLQDASTEELKQAYESNK
jgi:hypothetical protein